MFKAKMKHFGEDNQFLFLNSVSHLTLFVFDHGSRGHVTVADLSCNVSSRQNLSPNIQSNQGIRPEIFWAEFSPKFLLVLCNDHSTSVFDRTSLVKTRATSDDFSIDQESIISALVAPCETDVVISFIVGNSNTYLTRLYYLRVYGPIVRHHPYLPYASILNSESPSIFLKNQYNAIFT